jgi:hypothetical protein
MAKEKSIVEEAIIQMKNLEEAVAENAKGILASTMKEEIKELVKESLSEQEEEEVEDEENVDMEDSELGAGDIATMDMGDTEGDDMEDEDEEEEEEDMEDEEDAIDLTNKSDEEVLRVFKLMGPDDNIVVTKDESGNINIKDADKEYMIVGEGVEEMDEEEDMEMEMDEEEDMEMEMDEQISADEMEDISSDIFGDDENLYELEMDEESDLMGDADFEEEEEDEIMYEIDFGSEDEEEEEEEFFEEDESLMESKKMKIKAKGVGMGSPKFKYNAKPNMAGGFKEKMKQGPKSVGTGKAKFEYKEGENMDGKMKPVKKGAKKMETKEAARTLGNGSNFRKGGLPKPKAHSKANTAIKENFDFKEVELLREKNEEYRKALNVFRNKLNEVAVFNSNLAYATRLFTEHSTSKQEKINILRRFDGVETIKESKNLYQTIKDELSVTTSKGKSNVNESVERVIEKSQATGSSVNLIESKTYENPQFLRMKDLMAKIK